MQGPIEESTGQLNFDKRGLMPRCIESLFSQMSKQEKNNPDGIRYLCRASFCEIYNEYVYDLLDTATEACTVREDLKKGIYVDGVTEEVISCPEDAYRLLELGARNRHVAATSMNRESSRSHSIFTMIIQSKVTDGNISDVRESRFNLVDLAGSERQKMTSTTGQRLKEAGNINKSLLALGNVINALVDISNGRSRHVRYRDSKLTFLLKDSLGGNAKTALIATVDLHINCAGETLSTLRFAKRAKLIKNNAVVNQEYQGNVAQLQEEVKRLREQLELAQSGQSTNLGLATLLKDLNINIGDGEDDKLNLDNPSLRLVLSLLKQMKKSQQEKQALNDELEAAKKHVENQKRHMQNDKLIIKLREKTISSMRKDKDIMPEDYAHEEILGLKKEIASLQELLKHNPEVTRFAAENLHLKEQIKSLQESYDFAENIEEIKEENLIAQTQLSNSLLELEEKLKAAKNEEAVPKEMLIKIQGLVKKHHELQRQKDRMETELTDKVRKLENDLKSTELSEANLRDELLMSQNIVKELEAALEASKLSKEIEEKAKNAGVTIDSLNNKVSELEDANNRAQLKCGALEKKNNRLEELASQNKSSYEEQVKSLKDKICEISNAMSQESELREQIEMEKNRLQNQITELERSHQNKLQEFQELQNNLKKEKVSIEEESMRLSNDLRMRENEFERAMEDYQATKVNLEDTQGELDFTRERLVEISKSLEAKTQKNSELEEALANKEEKITSQIAEMEELKKLLEKSDFSKQELAETVQNLNSLQHEHDVKIFELENLKAEYSAAQEISQEKITKMQQELQSSQNSINDLHKKLSETRTQTARLQKTLESAEKNAAEFQADNDNLRNLLSAMEGRETIAYEELENIKSQLVDAEELRLKFSRDKENLEEKIKELALSLQNKESEAASLSEELSRKAADIENMRMKFANSESQNGQMLKELQAKAETLKNLQNNMSSLKAELMSKDELLRSYLEGPQASELKAELDQRAQRIAELEELSRRLEKLTSDYENSRKQKNSEISRLKKEVEVYSLKDLDYQKEVEKLKENLVKTEKSWSAKYNEELSKKDEIIKSVQSDMEKHLKTLADTKEQYHDLKQYNTHMKQKLGNVKAEKQKLVEQMNEFSVFKSKYSQISIEYEKLKKSIDASNLKKFQIELNYMKQLIGERENELNSERNRIQILEKQLDSVDFMENQANTLEQKLQYLVKRNHNLEDENEKLVKHNNYKQKLQYHLQIKQENNNLRVENQRLAREMERLEKKILHGPQEPTATSSGMSTRRRPK